MLFESCLVLIFLSFLPYLPESLYPNASDFIYVVELVGKIGIRIPSHNSLTPSLFDELLEIVAASRKGIDVRKARLRLRERYHVGIISTGLSYLAYLGAVEKFHHGYKPTRAGKKIGKLLRQERNDAANVAWGDLLKRHKLFFIFNEYFLSKSNEQCTLDDFSLYLKKKARTTWNTSAIRSRISRLCELFAEKGLIEYQNNYLSPIGVEHRMASTLTAKSFQVEQISGGIPVEGMKQDGRQGDTSNDSAWPIKMEIKIEVSEKAQLEIFQMILSFLKEIRSQGGLKIDAA